MALQITDIDGNSLPSTRVNTPEPPVSPNTTQSLLDTHPDLDAQLLQQIALGLVSTIRNRENQHRAADEDRREEIDMLRDRLNDYSKTYFTAPSGFVANNGRLPQFTVPTDTDIVQVIRWVKRLPDGRIAGHLQDDGPRDDPYITEIYASPAIPDPARPTEALPQWFRRLLTSPDIDYHSLRDAAYQLEDWSIHSEILRFRRLDDAVSILQIQHDALTNELHAARRTRRSSEARLEAARAHANFTHLEVARRGHHDRPRSARRCARRSVAFLGPEESNAMFAQED